MLRTDPENQLLKLNWNDEGIILIRETGGL